MERMLMPMVLLAAAAVAATATAGQPAVKRSDVVFMGPADPEVYKTYMATMVAWGGRPWADNPKALRQFKARIRAAHNLGMRYCAGLAFRTAFAGMIDYDKNFMASVCRTLGGEPITVPWLWDHTYKGNPAYWFCTNSPRYRDYLRYQARLATVTDVEGLHIDDYNGTAGTEWRGGCFCRWCMAAFRKWLAANVRAQKLAALGITSLEDFDYSQFLRSRGITTDQWRRKCASLPLGKEYLTFQYQAAAHWAAEIGQYAESRVGHRLLLSVNSSAENPKALVIAPQLDFFCGEVRHYAETLRAPVGCVWVYKMGDALGKPIVCTATGPDWAFINEQQRPGLVRIWIAQAYAYGHQFMVPHRQWAYTKKKGTHWYQSKPEDYAFLYRFVRRHSDLFDDYDAVAPVGVLYSNAAFRAGHRQARDAALELARENIPFRLVAAGDDWLAVPLSEDQLRGLQALVVTRPTMLTDDQQRLLNHVLAGRLVYWPDERMRLRRLVPPLMRLRGADNVAIVPRAKPGAPRGPFVCHLVNYNYLPDKDAVQSLENVALLISDALFGISINAASLYAPDQPPRQLAVRRVSGATEIIVPRLELWAVLKLSGS